MAASCVRSGDYDPMRGGGNCSAKFGIETMIVNPGFFRTELLTEESTNYAEPSVDDYHERRTAQIAFWRSQNGKQGGDPAKLARALITLTDQDELPRRFLA